MPPLISARRAANFKYSQHLRAPDLPEVRLAETEQGIVRASEAQKGVLQQGL
jgi:hypothetical protein